MSQCALCSRRRPHRWSSDHCRCHHSVDAMSPFIYFVHLIIISHLERWLNAIVVGVARMHASDEIDHDTGWVLHAFSKWHQKSSRIPIITFAEMIFDISLKWLCHFIHWMLDDHDTRCPSCETVHVSDAIMALTAPFDFRSRVREPENKKKHNYVPKIGTYTVHKIVHISNSLTFWGECAINQISDK